MDYIIFGIGSGATLVLTGWVLRDWGPWLRDRKPAVDELLSASDLVVRMAWARFCATCGTAILICGVLVMLVTLGAAFLAPSDNAAAITVVATFGLAMLLMLLWTGLYLRQFGALGVLRPREKQAPPEPSPAPEAAPTTTAAGGPTGEPKPAPSFAETTAARGGLGRFAAFFRKEPTPAGESLSGAGEAVSLAPVAAASAIESSTAAGDPDASPTDAVIAEIVGAPAAGEEKRLAPDDPLVTSVRDSTATALAMNESMGSNPQEAQRQEEPTPIGADLPGDTEGKAAVSGQSGQELALAQLRRRRMSRLSHPSEPD